MHFNLFELFESFVFELCEYFSGTFNAKLCEELKIERTEANIRKILTIVDEWNIYKELKSIYKGETKAVNPKRK